MPIQFFIESFPGSMTSHSGEWDRETIRKFARDSNGWVGGTVTVHLGQDSAVVVFEKDGHVTCRKVGKS